MSDKVRVFVDWNPERGMFESNSDPGLCFHHGNGPLGPWLEAKLAKGELEEVTGQDPATVRQRIGWEDERSAP